MSAPDNPPRQFFAAGMYGVVSIASVLFLVCAVTYTVTFNVMPDPLRRNLAGVLGAALLIAAIIVNFRHFSTKSLLMYAGLGLVLVSAVIDYTFETIGIEAAFDYIADTLKLVTALAAIAYFSSVTPKIKPIYFVLSCIAVAAVAALTYALQGTIMFGVSIRPAPFTGGLEGVHSSAYALTWAFLGTAILWRQASIPRWLALVIIVPLAVLVLYFQVRTTWFMVIAYFATIYVTQLRQDSTRWMHGLVIILILLLGVAAYQIVPDAATALSDFSSGRTTAYGERFGTLAGRTPFELIFGTGAGSDFVFTEAWWWNTGMDSHNSFIHFTVETGIIGLIGAIFVLVAATISANITQIAVIVSLIAASLVSNGPLERPMLGVLFATLLVLDQTAPPARQAQLSYGPKKRRLHGET
jgi:hypothetical protein